MAYMEPVHPTTPGSENFLVSLANHGQDNEGGGWHQGGRTLAMDMTAMTNAAISLRQKGRTLAMDMTTMTNVAISLRQECIQVSPP
jgi:hypothetical protein